METREYWIEDANGVLEGPYVPEELNAMLQQGLCTKESVIEAADSGDKTSLGDLLKAEALRQSEWKDDDDDSSAWLILLVIAILVLLGVIAFHCSQAG